MNGIYVEGLGVRLAYGEDLSVLARDISEERAAFPAFFADPMQLPLKVESPTLRRASSLAKLAVEAAEEAWREGGGREEERPACGTLFTNGYGSARVMTDFTARVAAHNPRLRAGEAAYVVDNAPLGQLCLTGGFRGPSAMLLAGDPLETAALWLRGDKARQVLCGAAEEITPELRAALEAGGAPGERFVTGAAFLLLTDAPSPEAVRVEGFAAAASEEGKLRQMLQGLISEGAPEAVLSAAWPQEWREAAPQGEREYALLEEKVLAGALPHTPRIFSKGYFGETLGCSYLANLALAAALLRASPTFRSLLALGRDTGGNCLAARLCRSER